MNNISPNKLGEKLNITSGTITGWKKGASPNADRLNAIADYFGVTTDYLLGRSGADPELPADEIELLKLYRKADERGKAAIRRTAEGEARDQEQVEQKSCS